MDLFKGIKHKRSWKIGISKDAAIITDIAAALDFSQDVFSLSLQLLILRETCFQTASSF